MAALALSNQQRHDETTFSDNVIQALTMQTSHYDFSSSLEVDTPDRQRRSLFVSMLILPCSASAAVPQSTIQSSVETLTYTLDRWEEIVVDCTYADVPRALLEQKNKELLLEKAATNALFDKSVSITSCKIVTNDLRDTFRRPPLSNINTALLELLPMMKDETALERIERVSYDLTRVDSLSFTSRRDYFALNNFDPEQTNTVLEQPGNLRECRLAIASIAEQLTSILSRL